MLTFVLIAALLVPSTPQRTGAPPPPREGYAASVSPKAIQPTDPAHKRAIFSGKVETAWLLADAVSFRSEPEARP